MKKVKRYSTRLIKKYLKIWNNLDESNLSEFSMTFLDQIERIREFRAFDIPHEELAKIFDSKWKIFLKNNITDWNTVIFDGFDMFGVKRFQNLVKSFNKNNNTSVREIVKDMDMISQFACCLHASERNGYLYPGFDNELYLKIWIPEYRKVYDLVTSFSDIEYKNNQLLRESFIMCCYAVTHFLLNICDYGLVSIKKELYQTELEFLKKSIRITQLINHIDLNGEVVDLIQIMGERNEDVLQMINQNHDYLIQKQLKNGAWIGESGNPCSHAVHTAITALLDHDYFYKGSKKFGKMDII